MPRPKSVLFALHIRIGKCLGRTGSCLKRPSSKFRVWRGFRIMQRRVSPRVAVRFRVAWANRSAYPQTQLVESRDVADFLFGSNHDGNLTSGIPLVAFSNLALVKQVERLPSLGNMTWGALETGVGYKKSRSSSPSNSLRHMVVPKREMRKLKRRSSGDPMVDFHALQRDHENFDHQDTLVDGLQGASYDDVNAIIKALKDTWAKNLSLAPAARALEALIKADTPSSVGAVVDLISHPATDEGLAEAAIGVLFHLKTIDDRVMGLLEEMVFSNRSSALVSRAMLALGHLLSLSKDDTYVRNITKALIESVCTDLGNPVESIKVLHCSNALHAIGNCGERCDASPVFEHISPLYDKVEDHKREISFAGLLALRRHSHKLDVRSKLVDLLGRHPEDEALHVTVHEVAQHEFHRRELSEPDALDNLLDKHSKSFKPRLARRGWSDSNSDLDMLEDQGTRSQDLSRYEQVSR